MINWIKRLFDSDKYTNASIRMVDQMGREGSAQPPFNYRIAVKSLRSWVYAAAWINSSAVAATPLRLYVRNDSSQKSLWRTRRVSMARKRYMMGDGQGDVRPSASVINKVMEMGDDMVEVTETHPVIELLRKANHVYNGFDLTLLRTLYQELTGNAYLHPIIDPALEVPTQLWPMPSQHVQVIPSRDNFVDGYLYGADDAQSMRFEADEVIHFKRPNPDNLFYGLGKVEAAYGSVAANQAVHEMDLSIFENHARPDYAVVVNGPHRRADLDVFEQHVSERLRGTRKAGQFLTVSGDVQFTPLNFPPKDLSGRDEIVEEIAAVFGVPVSMMKANDPNLASARAGFAQWRESTILPLLRMDEDVLNQILLPMFGIEEDACLAYDNPVPADNAFQLQERQAAVAGGWMTLNEARIAQGLEANDNPLADELLFNGQPLGAAPPVPGPPLGLAGIDTPIMTQEQEQDEIGVVRSMKSVLADVADGNLSAHAAITLCKKLGVPNEDAVEAVLSQSRIAMDRSRVKQVEPTHVDIYATKEEAMERARELGCSGFHEHEMEDGTVMYMPCGEMDDYTEITGLQHAKAVERGDMDLFSTREEAEERARELGCEGAHEHEMEDGTIMFMPCEDMSEYTDITGLEHAKAIEDVDLTPTKTMSEMAERGLRLREEHGRGGTAVGVARARDIKNRENLSPETVRRMQSFFARHRVDLESPAAKPGHEDYPSAGVIAWLLWGGDPSDPEGAGTAWANMKDRQLEQAAGSKAAGDRISATPAKPEERITGSDTNKPGTASGTRGGIEISEAQEKALKKKVEEHNEKHGDKKGKKVNMGMLKAVYRRGAGAFSTSHRPGMSRQQWSMARVNAFLYLVRNGRPKDAKYTTDNDLLPKGHPKKSDAKKQLQIDRDIDDVSSSSPVSAQIIRAVDADGDGRISTADLLRYVRNWIEGDESADINLDGNVDILDIDALGQILTTMAGYEQDDITKTDLEKYVDTLAVAVMDEDNERVTLDAALLLAGTISRFHGVHHGLPTLLRTRVNELVGRGDEDDDAPTKPRPSPTSDPGVPIGGTGATPGGGG